MERQNQAEEFDRPTSRAGGDMFPMNGHLNGSVSQQKSSEPQKSPLPSDKIPPVAPPEQKSPLPTTNVPSDTQKTPPFAANMSPVISSELQRLPSATSSAVGAEFQRPASAVSNVTAGEFQRPPSVVSSMIATEVQRPSFASSNVISAELERPSSAASSVIVAELQGPQEIIQKPELSKVMNGVALKPADGLKKGHAEGAGKDEEDDDNDVVIVSPPDIISSSSDEIVVEGRIRGSAINGVQTAGKPVIVESQLSGNTRFETMITTLGDTKDFAGKQEFKEAEWKEDSLNKTTEDNKPSGKEGKYKEDKEKESPKKEQVKGEEIGKKATEFVESPKKEPEKLTEKAEILASKGTAKEVAKKEESPKTSVDTNSKYAPVPGGKPGERAEEKPLKDIESVVKEMPVKTEESIKEETGKGNDVNTREKGNDTKETMASKNNLCLKEPEIVSPEKEAEISKKESPKKEEENKIEIKASSKNGEDKREFPTNKQRNEIGWMGNSASLDTTVINKETQRREEENKAENLAESKKKPTDEIQKDIPIKEKTKEIEIKEVPPKNETEKMKISHNAEEVCPKNETGHEGEKLENSSKKTTENVNKEFPVKEKQNEIERIEKSPKKDSEGGKEEFPVQEGDKLLGKQEELFGKDRGEIKKEETDIVKKAESPTKETEILKHKLPKKETEAKREESVETKLSTKEKEEKSEEGITPKKLPVTAIKSTSPGGDNKIIRPGSESPALSKSATPKKSRTTSESEFDTPKKTRTTPEETKSTPKKLAVKTAPETEGEKSPRARTPKDREEPKPKKKPAKKREKESSGDVSKKQGNGTATNITHFKAFFVCDISSVETESYNLLYRQ